jgi:hypothetical protein
MKCYIFIKWNKVLQLKLFIQYEVFKKYYKVKNQKKAINLFNSFLTNLIFIILNDDNVWLNIKNKNKKSIINLKKKN